MDIEWLQGIATALAADDEPSLLEGLRRWLGPDVRLTSWRAGRGEWVHAYGDDQTLPPVPDAPGVVRDGERFVVRVGDDLTASRVLAIATTRLDEGQLQAVASLLALAVSRLMDRQVAANARQRLADNERIGQLGSYDWHVPTDTNRWSDQLYRIYGEEPQSFNASYERFIDFIHPDDREKVQAIHQEAFATLEPYEMEERIVLADGTERLLWSNGEVIPGPDGAPERFIGICRDVTDQRAAERAAEEAEVQARRAHDASIRRQAALELNDVVVQGLTTAIWAAEDEARGDVVAVLRETLADARRMMDDLLVGHEDDGPPVAGQLRRATASPGRLPTDEDVPALDGQAPSALPAGALRVVLADDSPDIRMLLAMELRDLGVDVVGEAANGREAVALVAAQRPDAVLLDLSMPIMDGLEAAREIRRSAGAATRIVVVSGYGESTMSEAALAAGADAYVEKGSGIRRRLGVAIGITAA